MEDYADLKSEILSRRNYSTRETIVNSTPIPNRRGQKALRCALTNRLKFGKPLIPEQWGTSVTQDLVRLGLLS
jgi:hypothetical protein